MNEAAIAALLALAEAVATAYKKYETDMAAIPTEAALEAAVNADVAGLQSAIQADDGAANLAEDAKYPPVKP